MAAASSLQGYWLFGSAGCMVYAFGVGYFGLLSIVTLAAIAVERYLVITAKPMSASWKITQYGARKVCVVVWLYCLLMCVPPLLGWSQYIPEGFLTSCSWDYLSRTPANRAYYIYLLSLGFVVPVSVIAYCYTFILAAIFAHGREMRGVKAQGGGTNTLIATLSPQPAPSSTLRTAEIIIMLVGLFLLSWAPYTVVTLIGQFGDARLVTPWVAMLPALFAKASVVYNPIVYGLSHPHFRSSLKQYLSSFRTGSASAHNTMSMAPGMRSPRDGGSIIRRSQRYRLQYPVSAMSSPPSRPHAQFYSEPAPVVSATLIFEDSPRVCCLTHSRRPSYAAAMVRSTGCRYLRNRDAHDV